MTQRRSARRSTSTSDRSSRSRTRCRAAARGGERGKPCILSKNDGYVANEFGTITELAESPVAPGHLWAGTNDGNVQVSRDGGLHVDRSRQEHPGRRTTSTTSRASKRPGTTRAPRTSSLDGHRHDDLKPYVFKTTDYGQTWTSSHGQPAGVGQRQLDPAGSGATATCSTRRPSSASTSRSTTAQTWHQFMPNLPAGPRRRGARAPARQRPDPRAPRARHLDHGRHLGAAEHDDRDVRSDADALQAARRGALEARTARTRRKCPATSGGRAKSRRAARRSPTT